MAPDVFVLDYLTATNQIFSFAACVIIWCICLVISFCLFDFFCLSESGCAPVVIVLFCVSSRCVCLALCTLFCSITRCLYCFCFSLFNVMCSIVAHFILLGRYFLVFCLVICCACGMITLWLVGEQCVGLFAAFVAVFFCCFDRLVICCA